MPRSLVPRLPDLEQIASLRDLQKTSFLYTDTANELKSVGGRLFRVVIG